MPEARYFHVTPTERITPIADLETALARRGEGGYVWLDLHDPSREQLEAVAGPLGLHPLSIEDCLDEDQVPKVEDYPNHTFVLFNTFSVEGDDLKVAEVDLFLGNGFVICVHGHGEGHPRLFETVDKLMSGLDLDRVTRGPEFLLHVLLDHAIDRKLMAIETLQDRADESEELLIADLAAFQPGTLLRLRRSLLQLRKSLFHEREILVKLCRRDSPYISEKAVYHFRDVYDHLTKFFETVEVCREMVTNSMEMYLSMINNQMALIANRTNATVRRLTLITTVFMPLTLLSGVGGMSEWSMMTGPDNWRLAYPLFLLGMAFIGLISYRILLWLEARDAARE
jgi:magnesium transporter